MDDPTPVLIGVPADIEVEVARAISQDLLNVIPDSGTPVSSASLRDVVEPAWIDDDALNAFLAMVAAAAQRHDAATGRPPSFFALPAAFWLFLLEDRLYYI